MTIIQHNTVKLSHTIYSNLQTIYTINNKHDNVWIVVTAADEVFCFQVLMCVPENMIVSTFVSVAETRTPASVEWDMC